MSPPRRPSGRRRLRALALVVLAAVVVASCSDAYTEDEKLKAEGGANPAVVNIYVASPIVATIDQMTKLYELANPGINFVVLTSESALLAQTIADGARPTIWIDSTGAQGPFVDLPETVGEPRPVGFDVLQFFTLAGNPRNVGSVRIFGPAASVVTTGLCQESQPCGEAAYAFLRSRRIEPDPDVIYGDGLAVVVAVVNGEVDAGMAYRTDVVKRPAATAPIPMPNPDFARIDYQALQLAENPNAVEFLDWMTTSPEAITILARAGLLPLEATRS